MDSVVEESVTYKKTIKTMSKLIKEILTNKAVRNSGALMSLIVTIMSVGVPWADK